MDESGRQAPRGGDGWTPVPWRASAARRRQRCKPVGARRPLRLAAQHASATRLGRRTHRRYAVMKINVYPLHRNSKAPIHPYTETTSRLDVKQQSNKAVFLLSRFCTKPRIRSHRVTAKHASAYMQIRQSTNPLVRIGTNLQINKPPTFVLLKTTKSPQHSADSDAR